MLQNKLTIRNIADEIAERGHIHTSSVIKLEERQASADLARRLGVKQGYKLFHSVMVHFENGSLLQYEDRNVNPAIAPQYLSVDFEKHTPSEYLLEVAPLQEVEHIVQAVAPSPEIQALLKMSDDEPCLLLRRRTWTAGQVANVAALYHPGMRYDLSSHFKP